MLEFDRQTGQGGNRLGPLGLRETRITAATFLKMTGGTARGLFLFTAGFARDPTAEQTDRVSRCETKRNEQFGRSLGHKQDERDRRFHPPTTPLRPGRFVAEESVS